MPLIGGKRAEQAPHGAAKVRAVFGFHDTQQAIDGQNSTRAARCWIDLGYHRKARGLVVCLAANDRSPTRELAFATDPLAALLIELLIDVFALQAPRQVTRSLARRAIFAKVGPNLSIALGHRAPCHTLCELQTVPADAHSRAVSYGFVRILDLPRFVVH